MTEPHSLNLLPVGTELAEYTITGVLGEGGFGIVYRAEDRHLGREVAIKEYLPSAIAGRASDQSVRARSVKDDDAFRSGLQSFLREARMLAKFVDPSLVFVYRVWEERGTAYFSMRLCPGQTLREVRLSMDQGMAESDIALLLSPILHALERLHEQDIIHRDVSPDNIIISESSPPVLLDLGAARQQIGGMTSSLTSVLKPGYAPIEQYADDGSMKQGSWTDVYAVGALIYFLATGRAPLQSVMRVLQDGLKPMTAANADGAEASNTVYSQALTDTVLAALAIQPKHRIQSIAELRERLGWQEAKAPTPSFNFPANRVEAVRTGPKPVSQRFTDTNDPDATVVHKSSRKAAVVTIPETPANARPTSDRITSNVAKELYEQPTPSAAASGRNRLYWGSGALMGVAAVATGLSWFARPVSVTSSASSAAPPIASQSTNPVTAQNLPATAPAPTLPAIPAMAAPPMKPRQLATTTGETPVQPAPAIVADGTAKRDERNSNTAITANEKKSVDKVPPPQPKTTPQLAQQPTLPLKVRAVEQNIEERPRSFYEPKLTAQEIADEQKRSSSKEQATNTATQLTRPAVSSKETPIDSLPRNFYEPETAKQTSSEPKQSEPTKGRVEKAVESKQANQTVNDLAALAMASYKDGRVADARSYWARLAAQPEASARSRALAHANTARTYCATNDSEACASFFKLALRADPSWRLSDADAARTDLQGAWRNAQGK